MKEKIGNNIFIPMPVSIVGTKYNGKENYMTVGWVTRANANPPMIAIGIGNKHLTWKGIVENEEFSINFPAAKDYLKTDYMIKECPLSLECKVIEKMHLPTNTLFAGEIIGVYADKEYMDNNNFNYEKAGAFLLTMMDNTYWGFGKKIGNAWKDGKTFK
jgi:flavin reductase (DIM6/NTAB) family NADH-FMN oxidoreductase RutF